jgi:hypothetical protein
MEEKEIKDPMLYAKAYDAGYKIKFYNPELYERIESVFKGKGDEYSRGFLEGVKQADIELEKKKVEKNKEDLQNIRNKNQSKERGKDIER